MKIITQTADEMVLKEGNLTSTMIGVAFIVVGGVVEYKGHASSPIAIWIALAMVVVGIGLILFGSAITVTANKKTGQLFYQKKRVIGGQNTTYAVSDVLRIETRKQWRMENAGNQGNQNAAPPQPVLVAQSVIVFKNGREVPLDHQKTSSTTSVGGAVLMSGQGKESAMAYQVANFLNVPFQEIAPPSFGGGMQINIG
jgi:hypothetical protein